MSVEVRPPTETVHRRRRVAAVLALVVLAAAGWFLVALFQPFKGEGHGSVAVTVPKGAGVGEIADLLTEREVVSSGLMFTIRARLGGRSGDLKPGSYALKRDMSYAAAIDALTEGPGSNLVDVTIPEGRSRREIARIVSGIGLRGDYLDAT